MSYTDNANVKKWVRALESGKYEQTIGELASTDGDFCCLGVACEVAIKNGVKLTKKQKGHTIFYDKQSGVLPTVVKKWLGLRTDSGSFKTPEASYPENIIEMDLTELNDNGDSFKEIAKVIKSNPKGLFVKPKKVVKVVKAKKQSRG